MKRAMTLTGPRPISRKRWNEARTDSAVQGSPSWKVTPAGILKVKVELSALTSQDSARTGSNSVVLSPLSMIRVSWVPTRIRAAELL